MVLPPLPDSRAEPDGSAVIRVLSYNVRSLHDDTAALARVVGACAPDLLLVQEAPRFFGWRAAAARLARNSGLVVLGGGAGAAGPLLLCSPRVIVESAKDVLLPLTPGLHRRGFATAVVTIAGARLGVLSCHLSLRRDERLAQADLLLERLDAMDVAHAVAGGDINDVPTGEAFARLAGRLQDCRAVAPWGGGPTFTPKDPRRRIDAVFATPGIEVLGCGVPDGAAGVSAADLRAATDHLPVLAALRVPAATP
ncbi:endonuclease/exonuclease/phosphatase family protein [Streptomyces pratensis]|uniref:endonuclease/exonuclease/phosphatase family protein n=1 Tax=Streptomyces pratensis TaxID=1169025 RepID=UPI0030182B61